MTQVSGAQPSAVGVSDSRARVIGFLLLAPALLAWLWSYLVPTITTVVRGFQNYGPGRPGRWVGVRYYDYVLQHALGSVGLGLLLVLTPLIVGLLVAPVLAVFAHRAGRIARRVTLGLTAVPLVSYAPVAVALAWRTSRFRRYNFAAPDVARGAYMTVVAWTSIGLIVAVGTMLALAALRGRRPGVAMLAVGTVFALGVLAAGLQEFSIDVATGGGRAGVNRNPMMQIWVYAFTNNSFGIGAALSAVLLLILAVFGVAAVGLLLAVRARVEYAPAAHTSPARKAVPAVVTAVLLLGLLAVVVYALAPWLEATSSRLIPLPPGTSAGAILAYTWLAPLLSVSVGLILALLGSIGIAVFRPLGEKSELLLLVFAPWLFVGIGPLALVERDRSRHQVDTFFGLIPPTWLSIPALVMFTLLLRGLSGQWRAAGGGYRRLGRMVALPALPMLGGAVLIAWLIGAQQFLWPWLMVNRFPGVSPAGVVAYNDTYGMLYSNLAVRPGLHSSALGLAYPLPLLALFVLVFAAFGIWYLERLAIQVGPEPRPAPSPSGEPAQSNQDTQAQHLMGTGTRPVAGVPGWQ